MNWIENINELIKSLKDIEIPERMSDFVGKNMKYISGDNDKMEYVVEFSIEKWTQNPRGELHGGTCCTFFDTTTGIAAIAAAGIRNVATVDLYTNFVARMPNDQTLEITTRVLKNGRKFIRLEAEAISKETGKLIATCMSNFVVLD